MKERIQQLVTRFMGEDAGALGQKLAGNAFGTFSLKILGTGLSFLLSVVLVRVLGGSGNYGFYSYAAAWLTLLAVPARLGMERLMVRKTSNYKSIKEWGLLKGLLSKATFYVFISSILVAIVMSGVFYFTITDEEKRAVTWLAMIGLPFLALRTTLLSALRGLNKVWVAQIPPVILYPSVILIGVSIFKLFGFEMNPETAILLNVASLGLTLFIGILLLRRFLPPGVKTASPKYEVKDWIRIGIPFMLIASMQNFNKKMGVLIIGAYHPEELIGVFSVCNRGTELIGFPLVAINLALAPVIAGLYAKRDFRKMQNFLRKAALLTMLGSVPITLMLMGLRKYFLLLYGPDFLIGQTTLVILCVGQLFYVALGSVGVILGMTKHEKLMAWSLGIAVAINFGLGFLLVPSMGLEGAAIASVTSTIALNAMMLIGVLKLVRVNPTIFGQKFKNPGV